MMKIFFRLFLFFSFLGVLVIAWESIPFPCEKPLAYSLGSFDPRFGITREDFLKEIARAEKVWEDTEGKPLFEYVPDAPFTVNLIFDERQEQTLAGQKLDQSFSETKTTQETLSEKNAASLALYRASLKEYAAFLASFEKRMKEYNKEVEDWNKQGGAPSEEYVKLLNEAEKLLNLQKQLEDMRLKVNALADTVNQFAKEQVKVVEKYNSQVENYVQRYGEPRDFDQGIYGGTSINIYQFDDSVHLRLVLAHELGHALGIGHVDDPFAIMYYLMEKQNPDVLTLTAADQAALREVCEVSSRNIIRDLSSWYRSIVE